MIIHQDDKITYKYHFLSLTFKSSNNQLLLNNMLSLYDQIILQNFNKPPFKLKFYFMKSRPSQVSPSLKERENNRRVISAVIQSPTSPVCEIILSPPKKTRCKNISTQTEKSLDFDSDDNEIEGKFNQTDFLQNDRLQNSEDSLNNENVLTEVEEDIPDNLILTPEKRIIRIHVIEARIDSSIMNSYVKIYFNKKDNLKDRNDNNKLSNSIRKNNRKTHISSICERPIWNETLHFPIIDRQKSINQIDIEIIDDDTNSKISKLHLNMKNSLFSPIEKWFQMENLLLSRKGGGLPLQEPLIFLRIEELELSI
ncbi:hypothetical protein TRFO_27074 [Tritrichomonas foetus]|uniref:C2 domain-containing protein n=1 Tax=Tritrichomonas foetus TaxID=1144522 RepID=A0A1J4K355_9EUKA|nr:hypothetical protein TRFO_27074 [Tritrichomonas foetus]|eukprot:OHT05256.1 hypothetical protein TRFO_27074 [Tritrichomonas foetus]